MGRQTRTYVGNVSSSFSKGSEVKNILEVLVKFLIYLFALISDELFRNFRVPVYWALPHSLLLSSGR